MAFRPFSLAPSAGSVTTYDGNCSFLLIMAGRLAWLARGVAWPSHSHLSLLAGRRARAVLYVVSRRA